MDKHHYRLLQPNDDPTLAVIEKSGMTAEFTLAEVQAMQEHNRKAEREIEGQLTVDRATLVNVERHHPQVKKMSPLLLTAAAIYKETQTSIAKSEPKLAQVKEAIKQNDEMIAHVSKELNLNLDGKTAGDDTKE